MLLSERMKQVRKELQLSQLEVANVLGCKVGKIKQIEGGKTISISFADAKILSDKFRINQRWLQDGLGEMFKEVSIKDIEDIELDITNENTNKIPFYSSIEKLNSSQISNYICLPNEILNLKDSCDLFAIHLNCESMKPTILSDNFLIFDMDKKTFKNGKIFKITYNNKIFIKRLFEMPTNKILLKSDNELFPSIEVAPDEIKLEAQLIYIINITHL